MRMWGIDARFPVLPVDILASRGVGRRGEKWKGMGFKVGQLFIWPLAEDLFSVDAFSTVPLLTFPLSHHCVPHPPQPCHFFFALIHYSPSFLPIF